MKFAFCAQTRLLSNELCHVTSPKRGGLGPILLGFSTGLKKWVMIWTDSPKTLVNNVASGRALLTVQETLPFAVGKHTYPCVPTPRPCRYATFPTGGVILSGVTGLAMLLRRSTSSAFLP